MAPSLSGNNLVERFREAADAEARRVAAEWRDEGIALCDKAYLLCDLGRWAEALAVCEEMLNRFGAEATT